MCLIMKARVVAIGMWLEFINPMMMLLISSLGIRNWIFFLIAAAALSALWYIKPVKFTGTEWIPKYKSSNFLAFWFIKA